MACLETGNSVWKSWKDEEKTLCENVDNRWKAPLAMEIRRQETAAGASRRNCLEMQTLNQDLHFNNIPRSAAWTLMFEVKVTEAPFMDFKMKKNIHSNITKKCLEKCSLNFEFCILKIWIGVRDLIKICFLLLVLSLFSSREI